RNSRERRRWSRSAASTGSGWPLGGGAASPAPLAGGMGHHLDGEAAQEPAAWQVSARWSFGFPQPGGRGGHSDSAARRERWSFGLPPPGGNAGRSDFRRLEEALVVRISAAQSGAVVIEFLPLEGRGDHSNFSGLEGAG